MSKEIAVVAVFGDLGRSPRMINHARELLKMKYEVNVLGYDGDVDQDVALSPNAKFHFIYPFNFDFIKKYTPLIETNLKLLLTFLRIILLTFNLALIMAKLFFFCKKPPKIMIIQTPPILPLLLLSPIFCLISGTKLIVDWHNLGFTLVDKKHWLLRSIYQKIESCLGKLCSLNGTWRYICVSRTMKNWITKNFNTKKDKIDVLYDRPSEKYAIFSEKERHMARQSFFEKFNIVDKDSLIFVSSTSWTPDEDFGILLDAVIKSEKQLSKIHGRKRNILLIITGKGPMRKSFEDKVKFMNLKNYKILTAWLEQEAYPKLLSCSDLGISLHTSSSGLDLPMKIVDMLGSGLPVCAFDYECLSELLNENKYGFLFRNSTELCQIMTNISIGKESGKLGDIRLKILNQPSTKWSQEWGNWFKNITFTK